MSSHPIGLSAHAKTLAEARAVAESRRVPQTQRLAAGGVDQDVTLGGLGDVRLVAHLADVPPQEGPRERRLADVGMGHEAQIHDGRRARGHGDHAGAGCHSAARRRSTAPPSAAAVLRGEIEDTRPEAARRHERLPGRASRHEPLCEARLPAHPLRVGTLVDQDEQLGMAMRAREPVAHAGDHDAVALVFRRGGEAEQERDHVGDRHRRDRADAGGSRPLRRSGPARACRPPCSRPGRPVSGAAAPRMRPPRARRRRA